MRWIAALLLALAAISAQRVEGAAEPGADGGALSPISAVLGDANGDTVPDLLGQRARVRGIVVVPPGVLTDRHFHALIQDATAGVGVFAYDLELPLRAGELIEVEGTVGQFLGAVQLQEPEIRRVAEAALPEAVALSVEEASAWSHMGLRATVEGHLGRVQLRGSAQLRLRGENGSEITLYLPKSVLAGFDWSAIKPGARVQATGALSIYKREWPYDSGFQLLVTRPQDLDVLAPPPPRWRAWALYGAIAAVLVAAAGVLLLVLVRRRVKARERELATLSALSAAMGAAGLDAEQLARRTCEVLVAYRIADAVTVHGIDVHGQLQLLAASGIAADLLASVRHPAAPAVADPSQPARAPDAVALELAGALSSAGLRLLAVHALPSQSGAEGFLTAYSRTHRRLSFVQARTLLPAVRLLALGLENLAVQERARSEREQLRDLVVTDELTSLHNRRFLDEYLRIQMGLARRRGGGLGFLMMDLDDFKSVNDTWGHAVGDRVLVRVAEELRRVSRSGDLPVRLGGEEFLMVVTEGDLEHTVQFAERLRVHMEATRFPGLVSGHDLRLTVSIGVGVYPLHGDTVQAILRACDVALYASKRGGRNRVTVAEPAEPLPLQTRDA